jgi:Tfp pilus assembly protein PilX
MSRARGTIVLDKGFVLAQVLVMTAVLGLVAALLLRMLLQGALYAASARESVDSLKLSEAALNRVRAAWDANAATCTSRAGDVACAGSGCNCTCTVDAPDIPGSPKVISTDTGAGACSLSTSY